MTTLTNLIKPHTFTKIASLGLLTSILSILAATPANAVLPTTEKPITNIRTFQPLVQKTSQNSTNSYRKSANITSFSSTSSGSTSQTNAFNKPQYTTPSQTSKLSASSSLSSNPSQSVSKKVVAYLVKNSGSTNEQIIPMSTNTTINAGDIIEYRTQLTNTTANHIVSMVASVTIPDGVELVSNVSPAYALASTGNGNFRYMPLKQGLSGENMPLSYYKALRWNLNDLGLNETTTLTYRAKIK